MKVYIFLGVTALEAINSVFKKTDENNRFLITAPGDWTPNIRGKIINRWENFIEHTTQNNHELNKCLRG